MQWRLHREFSNYLNAKASSELMISGLALGPVPGVFNMIVLENFRTLVRDCPKVLV